MMLLDWRSAAHARKSRRLLREDVLITNPCTMEADVRLEIELGPIRIQQTQSIYVYVAACTRGHLYLT